MTIEANPNRNIEAIDKAIELIDRVPQDRLHMRNFFERAECGTACCLAGWMALHPWFQAHTRINEVFAGGWVAMWLLQRILGIGISDTANLFALRGGNGLQAHDVTPAEIRWNLEELRAGRHARPYAALAYERDSTAGDKPAARESESARQMNQMETTGVEVPVDKAVKDAEFIAAAATLFGTPDQTR